MTPCHPPTHSLAARVRTEHSSVLRGTLHMPSLHRQGAEEAVVSVQRLLGGLQVCSCARGEMPARGVRSGRPSWWARARSTVGRAAWVHRSALP